MQRSRSRLYGATLVALAGLTVTASATFASGTWSSQSDVRWVAGPNSVINSSMATDTSGWAGWSDAGPVEISRITGLTGRFAGSTGLQITREATNGTWGEVLGDLKTPESYFKPGSTYRMSVWVRDLDASNQTVGMLIANGNYIHRPSDDSVYLRIKDTKWHQLTKTFVATNEASADTKFYLGLSGYGKINIQMTAASIVSLTPVAATNPTPAPSTPTSVPTTPIATKPAPAPSTSTPTKAPTTPTTSAPSGASRVISFEGPAGSRPNPNDWNYEVGGNGWGHDELQTYTDSTANSYVDGNGHLVITARRQTATGPDGRTRNYTSARISTANKVVVQPGSYVEAAITAPVGNGLWPAFWTIGTNINDVGWPRSGEIDIMEGTGSEPTLTRTNLHMSRLSNMNENNQVGWGATGATTDLGSSLDAGPHTYGVYFDANEVRFYVDRKMTQRFTAAQAAASDRDWPFGRSQYLILNVAVSDGTPDSTSFPRSMVVSPIGIYSKMPF
jgi:beta-glucanase (GH16 family)